MREGEGAGLAGNLGRARLDVDRHQELRPQAGSVVYGTNGVTQDAYFFFGPIIMIIWRPSSRG